MSRKWQHCRRDIHLERCFFPIDRELVAMALNQAFSKWSVTIVTLRPCKTHSFTDSVILLHWATLLSFAKQLIPLDNFETKLHNDQYTTVVLRCPGAKWASGHQQPHADYSIPWPDYAPAACSPWVEVETLAGSGIKSPFCSSSLHCLQQQRPSFFHIYCDCWLLSKTSTTG